MNHNPKRAFHANRRKIEYDLALPTVILCLFTFLGALGGSYLGNLFSFAKGLPTLLGILTGILLGITIGLFIHSRLHREREQKRSLAEQLSVKPMVFPPTEDKVLLQYQQEVKKILECRKNAAMRLNFDEFWIQTISIFYSCFTAALSVLGLMHSGTGFIDKPCVVFTVLVAILVTYANALKCGSRANDLLSNCNDLFYDYSELLDCHTSKEGRKIMARFKNHLGDSESHRFPDEWKFYRSWKYKVYILVVGLLIAFFFLVPMVYVFICRRAFLAILLA